MAKDEFEGTDRLRHADFSSRSERDLSGVERAEIGRRFDAFMRHFRAGKLGAAPPAATPRRIRKWRP